MTTAQLDDPPAWEEPQPIQVRDNDQGEDETPAGPDSGGPAASRADSGDLATSTEPAAIETTEAEPTPTMPAVAQAEQDAPAAAPEADLLPPPAPAQVEVLKKKRGRPRKAPSPLPSIPFEPPPAEPKEPGIEVAQEPVFEIEDIRLVRRLCRTLGKKGFLELVALLIVDGTQ